ncbi:MAG: rhomboid family intramembrane serine protease [Flavobacteriales bacterium]|nr:rhomboid family intramembrane serine protease [Flavobacteriales bacterium]
MDLSSLATLVIIVMTVLVSVTAFGNVNIFGELLFDPYLIKLRGQWYRFFTHAFIHANWSHLLVNMFVLYMFGRNVEPLLGVLTNGSTLLPYLALYVGGIVFSSLPSYRRHVNDPNYRAVGASGAVSAVLFAQILMLPTMPVRIMFIPVDLPAWVFGIIYLWYSWYMDKRGGDNVAHDAHFFGAVYGIVFITFLDPSLLLHIGSFQRSLGL